MNYPGSLPPFLFPKTLPTASSSSSNITLKEESGSGKHGDHDTLHNWTGRYTEGTGRDTRGKANKSPVKKPNSLLVPVLLQATVWVMSVIHTALFLPHGTRAYHWPEQTILRTSNAYISWTIIILLLGDTCLTCWGMYLLYKTPVSTKATLSSWLPPHWFEEWAEEHNRRLHHVGSFEAPTLPPKEEPLVPLRPEITHRSKKGSLRKKKGIPAKGWRWGQTSTREGSEFSTQMGSPPPAHAPLSPPEGSTGKEAMRKTTDVDGEEMDISEETMYPWAADWWRPWLLQIQNTMSPNSFLDRSIHIWIVFALVSFLWQMISSNTLSSIWLSVTVTQMMFRMVLLGTLYVVWSETNSSDPSSSPPSYLWSPRQLQELRFTVLCWIFIFGISFVMQFMYASAGTAALYNSHQLRAMNEDRLMILGSNSYDEPTPEFKKRVVFVVVDGLRWDAFVRSPGLRSTLLEREQGGWGVHFWRSQAALPTVSVPNWLTLLSGASPYVTGIHGNLWVSETEFDTMFSVMARYDNATFEFMRGMAGSEWFSDLVRSQFPRMEGLGTVYDATQISQPGGLFTGNWGVEHWPHWMKHIPGTTQVNWLDFRTRREGLQHPTQAYANVSFSDYEVDRLSTTRACQALQRVQDPYRFFLLHLANPDTQAHHQGVTNDYNPHQSYFQSCEDTADMLQEILETVGNHPWAKESVVVLVSDHGEVDPGGHGGAQEIVRRSPLVVFTPPGTTSSNLPYPSERDNCLQWLHQKAPSADRYQASGPLWKGSHACEEQFIHHQDIAPSLMAMMGLPTPRQAEGVLHPLFTQHITSREQLQKRWYDRIVAKRQLFITMLIQHGTTSRVWHSFTQHHIIHQSEPNTLQYYLQECGLRDTCLTYLHHMYQQLDQAMEDHENHFGWRLFFWDVIIGCSIFFLLMLWWLYRSYQYRIPFRCTSAMASGFTVILLSVTLAQLILWIHQYRDGYTQWDNTVTHDVQQSMYILRFGWWSTWISVVLISRIALWRMVYPFLEEPSSLSVYQAGILPEWFIATLPPSELRSRYGVYVWSLFTTCLVQIALTFCLQLIWGLCLPNYGGNNHVSESMLSGNFIVFINHWNVFVCLLFTWLQTWVSIGWVHSPPQSRKLSQNFS